MTQISIDTIGIMKLSIQSLNKAFKLPSFRASRSTTIFGRSEPRIDKECNSAMNNWLVISNCNTFGLANSLTLLYPSAKVTWVTQPNFQSAPDEFVSKFHDYSLCFCHPSVQELAPFKSNRDRLRKTIVVPAMHFAGYHPDVTYIVDGGRVVNSPIGGYHSAICFLAHQAGLSASAAESLFTHRTYEAAGYYDVWNEDKKHVLKVFASSDVDISREFLAWTKRGPFMHSINHPMIDCIYTTAEKILIREGFAVVNQSRRPHDNLLNGAWCAIYPEIAEATGVRGSYQFKIQNDYRIISLHDFIHESYRIYDREPPGRLKLMNEQYERFRKLQDIIGS